MDRFVPDNWYKKKRDTEWCTVPCDRLPVRVLCDCFINIYTHTCMHHTYIHAIVLLRMQYIAGNANPRFSLLVSLFIHKSKNHHKCRNLNNVQTVWIFWLNWNVTHIIRLKKVKIQLIYPDSEACDETQKYLHVILWSHHQNAGLKTNNRTKV